MKCSKCNVEFSEWQHDWCEDQPLNTYTIYNGEYGCDTGCEYVRLGILCSCGFESEFGEFGSFDNQKDKEWYLKILTELYNRRYKMS